MRHAASPPAGLPLPETHLRQTLAALMPYLWRYRTRVVLALSCLILAKVANVGVPMVFKEMIDQFTPGQQVLAMPIGLLLLYGLMRFSTALFTELRELIFARVTHRVIREIALQAFRHLHALSLRFHLARQTGGISRDIERGTSAISNLISYALYSILPTLIEIGLVLGILILQYDAIFVLITLTSLACYVVYTVQVSNWRIDVRRAVNDSNSAANSRAVDSLINYETVKYFNNEAYEARRYDQELIAWESASTRSQTSLAVLNLGQQIIIALGVTAMMWHAAERVVAQEMSIGDLVLVNALLIQLYVPLNFLGIIYRQVRQAFTDIERMFNLLNEQKDVPESPHAQPLPSTPPAITFEQVHFAYDPKRPILRELSFHIPAGKTLAVVGQSGSGKSTLARLLYRFYDVTEGSIRIGGHDLRHLQQDSLRRAIGIVPQDTVLFNESIYYNIQYGRPDASRAEVEAAAEAAQLSAFIRSLPKGFETQVGERGLKLSGGEKQRVAIARALLKNPAILIFDEATSALDSATERAIQAQIESAAQGRTTLMIAHRLSTILHADHILVLAHGEIVEEGNHASLLAAHGHYAEMWRIQQEQSPVSQPGDADLH